MRVGAYRIHLHAESLEYAHGEGHGLHVVAFVVVEAALHGHYALAAEVAYNEVAAVALYGRDWEVGNFAVGEVLFVFDIIYQRAEAGTEYNGELGHFAFYILLQVFCGLFDFFEHCCMGFTLECSLFSGFNAVEHQSVRACQALSLKCSVIVFSTTSSRAMSP